MQHVMKPVARAEWPTGKDWLYEVKYDGFRCVLEWDGVSIKLTSKNHKDLSIKFPEITKGLQQQFSEQPPMTMDGELVILNNRFQANFPLVQQRGRLNNPEAIKQNAYNRPATFMAFDIITYIDADYRKTPFIERKKRLNTIIAGVADIGQGSELLRFVPAIPDIKTLWQQVFDHKGEGIIAKRKKGTYEKGKQHQGWFKVKNWRTIKGALTAYDTSNGYFTVSVKDRNHWEEIGKCKHGLDGETRETLLRLFTENGHVSKGLLQLPPAIEAEIHTLDLYESELREPEFMQIYPLTDDKTCTTEQLNLDLAMFPETVDVSNTGKPFWPEVPFSKGDMLVYLREAAPYMLPFLQDRTLTLIRFPDGITGTHFFQKHLPDYAPAFINRLHTGDDVPIQCQTLQDLLWFGNHGAIEYHIPFQYVGESFPSDIVFDLDPPERSYIYLAVKAARLIKQMLDGLELTSFVKTSGGKGLQIHIPLPKEQLTYEDTAVFTEAIAKTIEQAEPDLFTTERMKNKRKGRLYIDYVQHGKDKTIIAPYSPRSSQEGTVATPLFWHELTEDIQPESFTIQNVVARIQTLGCPLSSYFEAGKRQPMEALMRLIK